MTVIIGLSLSKSVLNSLPMDDSEIKAALNILEELEVIQGQARNQRLSLLKNNHHNHALKTLLFLAYDWRIEFNVNCVGLLWEPDKNTSKEPLKATLEQFLNLTLGTLPLTVGLLPLRRKYARLLNQADPLLKKWLIKILDRDLGVYIGLKILKAIYPCCEIPDFVLPPSSNSTADVQVLIFINKNKSWAAYTDGFRKVEIIDCFARQFQKLRPETVYIGQLQSNYGTEFLKSILHSHLQGIPRKLYNSVYYGLKFKLEAAYSYHDYNNELFSQESNRALECLNGLQQLHPRTGIYMNSTC